MTLHGNCLNMKKGPTPRCYNFLDKLPTKGCLFINFIMTCVLQKRGDPIKEETTYTPHKNHFSKGTIKPKFLKMRITCLIVSAECTMDYQLLG